MPGFCARPVGDPLGPVLEDLWGSRLDSVCVVCPGPWPQLLVGGAGRTGVQCPVRQGDASLSQRAICSRGDSHPSPRTRPRHPRPSVPRMRVAVLGPTTRPRPPRTVPKASPRAGPEFNGVCAGQSHWAGPSKRLDNGKLPGPEEASSVHPQAQPQAHPQIVCSPHAENGLLCSDL